MPAKKTVAIVGSHPVTRSMAPYTKKYVDIWAFNEAANQKWLKRWDAIFQLHKPPIWKNPKNQNDPGHYEWLKQDHGPGRTIYMQDQYPDVPNSVKLPLDELCADLFPLMKRKQGRHEAPARYFTSSVPYAIALAIYQGYERIELYGVEMATATEYVRQRDGVMLLAGIALGRGIELIVPDESTMFKALLYGYEGDVVLHRQFFETLAVQIDKQGHQAQAQLQQMTATVNLILREIQAAKDDEAVGKLEQKFNQANAAKEQALINLGAAQGAMQAVTLCLNQIDEMADAIGGQKAIDAMMPDALRAVTPEYAVDGAAP